MLLLAADGCPLEPGQIVYGIHDGTPWHVEHAKHFSMNDETVVIVSATHAVSERGHTRDAIRHAGR